MRQTIGLVQAEADGEGLIPADGIVGFAGLEVSSFKVYRSCQAHARNSPNDSIVVKHLSTLSKDIREKKDIAC